MPGLIRSNPIYQNGVIKVTFFDHISVHIPGKESKDTYNLSVSNDLLVKTVKILRKTAKLVYNTSHISNAYM